MQFDNKEIIFMLKFSCGRCMSILAVFLGMLQIFLISSPIIMSSFMMFGLENGTI